MERLVNNRSKAVPQFWTSTDAEINHHRLVGSKRSSPDSAFPALSREAMARIGTNSNESSYLMKVPSNEVGDRSKRSNDEYGFVGMQRLQQGSGSLVLHPVTKWDRKVSMNVGHTVQFPPRIQNSPMVPSTFPNRFREVKASGSPTMSQTAADEGSRTQIKGLGISSSIKTGVGAAKNSSGSASPADRAVMTRSFVTKPVSLSTSSQNGMRPGSRQMTIFYGGQAHVFDDVHPNKADAIMALAGSNGGSWSTLYSPKSKLNLSNESDIIIKENSSGCPNNLAFLLDSCKNPPATRDPIAVDRSRDWISYTAGD